ncbi:MAG: hypothetical protein L3K09_08355 [Thermoplasmata archaeon]|nr:hypothetical protein [Thermoplasmata archaeon]
MERPEYEDDLENGFNYFGVLRVPLTASQIEVFAAYREILKETLPFGGPTEFEAGLLERAKRTLTGPDRAAYEVALSRTTFKHINFLTAKDPDPNDVPSPRHQAALDNITADARAYTLRHTLWSPLLPSEDPDGPGEAMELARARIEEAEDRSDEPGVQRWMGRQKAYAAAAKLPLEVWVASTWMLERTLDAESRGPDDARKTLANMVLVALDNLLAAPAFPERKDDADGSPPSSSRKPRGGEVRPFTPSGNLDSAGVGEEQGGPG